MAAVADPFSPSLEQLAAQAARESAARRLAGNVQARPRAIPYPWGSMGDWLNEALQPERIEQMFMGLGTDTPRGGKPFWENLRGVQMPPARATRESVLTKLVANRDFRPQLREGRMWFASLSPAENEAMSRIGWPRAPNVTFQDETSPERSAWAWEQNIRHWLTLAKPSRGE